MGFRIATNTASIAAQRSLSQTNRQQESILSKLSSGSRITKAADDAAGLAISEKLRATIRSAQQANRNANDGISMIQVAEGGLNEIGNILVRMRELAIQSSSDTVGEQERSFTDKEYQSLKLEIQRISEVTEFNGRKLLDGTGDKYDFQIGMNNNDFQDRISYNAETTNATTDALEVSSLAVNSKADAQESLAIVDSALEKVSENRSELGALQNRLQSTSNNLEIMNENLSAANSRIRDLDYAQGSAMNAKNTILNQAGTSVLAQANANGSNALRLIS
jgi:flagellin